MDLLTSVLPGRDTFVIVNGHRVRIGRDWDVVTSGELSDSFARAFREIGAVPLVMSRYHRPGRSRLRCR